MCPADVVYLTEWKSISEGARSVETVYFSHLEDAKGKARRAGAKDLLLSQTSATSRRIVADILRKKIAKLLTKRKNHFGKIQILFPMDKSMVLKALGEELPIQRNGKKSICHVPDLRTLDFLCGNGWDLHAFQDGFGTFVTSLQLSVSSTQYFTLSYRIALMRPTNMANYREQLEGIYARRC